MSFRHHAFCFYKSNMMNRRSGAGATMNLSSMKRLLLLVSIFMAISGESCSKQEDTPQEDLYLTVFPTELDFPYEGETIEVLVQSNAPLNFAWSPSPSKPDWLKMSATSSGFTFSAQENKTFYARGAMLMIYTNEINGKVSQSYIDFYQIGKPQN